LLHHWDTPHNTAASRITSDSLKNTDIAVMSYPTFNSFMNKNTNSQWLKPQFGLPSGICQLQLISSIVAAAYET
jgi:hypothetical protein